MLRPAYACRSTSSRSRQRGVLAIAASMLAVGCGPTERATLAATTVEPLECRDPAGAIPTDTLAAPAPVPSTVATDAPAALPPPAAAGGPSQPEGKLTKKNKCRGKPDGARDNPRCMRPSNEKIVPDDF